MTRINSAIQPKCLTDEHLMAEHREIKRLPYNLKQAVRSGSVNKIPEKFVLGTGHVLFFVDKQNFLYKRYGEIWNELMDRGFSNITSYFDNWQHGDIDNRYWNDHTPTQEEHDLLIQRISQRIMESKKKCWHYRGNRITKEEAIKLLFC